MLRPICRVLFLLALLWPVASWAAISEVQKRSTTVSTFNSTTLAYTSNVTSGNLLIIVGNNWRSGGASIAVSDTLGTSYTVKQNAFTNNTTFIIYGIAPSSGANTITLDPTSSGNYAAFTIVEYSGVDTVTPLDVDGSTSTGTSTSASDSLTTTTADALIIGVMGFTTATTITLTPGGSYIQLGEYEDNNAIVAYNAVSRIATSATSYTVDWTMGSSDTWYAQTAAFKAAGGGGASVATKLMMLGVGP